MTGAHKLGWRLAALVVAGNMIGSGLYLLPVSLAAVGSSSVLGWVIAGAGALTLALVFGALGRVMPTADGLAGIAEQGLGRFFGYQTALGFWACCLIGNVAVAVAATGYLAFFWPVLKDPVPATLCNLVLIWLATGAYIAGAGTASRLAAVALIVGLIPIAIAVAAGASAFDPAVFQASWSATGEPLAQAVPASLVIIFWAYLGLESAAAISRRLKDPARDLRRATIGGVLLATVVYVAASVAVFGVIPLAELARSTSPYADLAGRVFGASLAAFVALCAIAKTLGTLQGWVLLGGETARSAAGHGFLPRGFGRGERTPVMNPLLGGAIMSIAAILSGQPTLGDQFSLLIGAVSVLALAIYGVCAAALFRRGQGRDKALAVVGFVFALAAVAAAAADYIWPTVGFIAVTTAGYLLFVRRHAVDPKASAS